MGNSVSLKLRMGLKKIYKRCRFCHSKDNLEFHHISPKNKTKTRLIALCHKCHTDLHNEINRHISIRVKKEMKEFKKQYRKNNPKKIREDIKGELIEFLEDFWNGRMYRRHLLHRQFGY